MIIGGEATALDPLCRSNGPDGAVGVGCFQHTMSVSQKGNDLTVELPRKGFDSKPTCTGKQPSCVEFWPMRISPQPLSLDSPQSKKQRKSLTSQNEQASNQRQHRDAESTAESHERDDEGDDEDDEAYDHQGSDRLSPCWRDNEEQEFSTTR